MWTHVNETGSGSSEDEYKDAAECHKDEGQWL